MYRYGSSVQKCCKPSLQVNNRAARTDPDAELTLSRAGLSSTMYSLPFSDAAASDLAGDQATISNLSEGGLLDSSREPEQKPFALMSAAKEAKMAICMQGGPSKRSSGRRSSAEAGQPVVGCRWLTPPPSPPSQVLAPCQATLPTPQFNTPVAMRQPGSGSYENYSMGKSEQPTPLDHLRLKDLQTLNGEKMTEKKIVPQDKDIFNRGFINLYISRCLGQFKMH